MQKIKIQNTWNDSLKKYDKDEFDLKETDKIIYGQVTISSKVKDKFISMPLRFIAFKSKLTQNAESIIKSGLPFFADFNLTVNEYQTKDGELKKNLQMIINDAYPVEQNEHYEAKANGYQPQSTIGLVPQKQEDIEIIDDEIPF